MSQREVELPQLSPGEDKKHLGPQSRPLSMSEIPQIDGGLDMSQSIPVPEGDLCPLVPDPATDSDLQIYGVCKFQMYNFQVKLSFSAGKVDKIS